MLDAFTSPRRGNAEPMRMLEERITTSAPRESRSCEDPSVQRQLYALKGPIYIFFMITAVTHGQSACQKALSADRRLPNEYLFLSTGEERIQSAK